MPAPMTSDTASADLLGRRFDFRTAPGLFSAGRVDDGTRLLLSHLPATTPHRVLDLGCGYGALGLPIAAAHPAAEVTLVDRDLLAVAMSRVNATAFGLTRVRCSGSLGYRDVPADTYDWIVCNVPARIGAEAIAYILGAGAARLSARGELRVVVIRDLEPVVRGLAGERRWPVEHVTGSARHGVFRLAERVAYETDHGSIYRRDTVTLPVDGAMTFERPQDISEDPAHLRDALPLLLECLPRKVARAFVWRGGYGVAAIALARRGAEVMAADRDLLATTYTRRNAVRLGVAVSTADVLNPGEVAERYDLVLGELSPAAGLAATIAEAGACLSLMKAGGAALWLGPSKHVRDWLGQGDWKVAPLASRGAYRIVRLSR